jgi:general secretion pathway protein H|tara:strand:+ start:1242 stop:1784 length:543 start_codon:yes stop_codon:yes gene_type:complete
MQSLLGNSPFVQRTARGFTLIEILVVMLVIGIAVAVIGFSFSTSNSYYSANAYAQRVAQRIEMARDRAIQSNSEWGMFVEEDNYRFANFDPINGEWFDFTNKPFNAEKTNYTLNFKVTIEDYPGQVESDDEELPDLIFFSSGEVSPFALDLKIDELPGATWNFQSDGFSQVRAEQLNNSR